MNKNYLVIIILIISLSLNIWYIFEDRKPKSSVDITNRIIAEQNFKGLLDKDMPIANKNLDEYEQFFSSHDLEKVNQFTIVEYKYQNKDEVLVIRTNPGLIKNQLFIQDIKIVNKNDLSSILND